MSWRGAARQAGPRCGALPMTVLLEGARIVTPTRVLDPGWVEVAGDRIAAVGPGGPCSGPAAVRGRAGRPVGGADRYAHARPGPRVGGGGSRPRRSCARPRSPMFGGCSPRAGARFVW